MMLDGADAYEEQMAALEKIKRREKKLAKEKADATITTRWLILLGPLHAFLILVPIFGPSWINTKFTGFGVSMVTLRTSLFVIDVNVDCEKNYLEDKICKHVKKFEGVHPLSRARDTFCSIPGSGHSSCTMVRTTFLTSFFIFFFFTLSAGFHMFASAFLYYYWEQKPIPQARRFAMLFFFLGPFTAVFGLVAWSGMTPNLNELARSWTSTVDSATAGIQIFSYQNVHDVQYGWCWFYSLVVICLSLISMLVWPFFFVEHPKEEEVAEQEDQLKDLALSYHFFGDGFGYDYGSVQPGYNMAQYPGGEQYAYAGMQQQQQQQPGYPGMQQQQYQSGVQFYGASEAYVGAPGGDFPTQFGPRMSGPQRAVAAQAPSSW